jgi:hypothetical protein
MRVLAHPHFRKNWLNLMSLSLIITLQNYEKKAWVYPMLGNNTC